MIDLIGIADYKKGLLWGGIAGILFIFLNSFNGIFQIGFPQVPQSITTISRILVVGVLAPIIEESVFRGVLLGFLRQKGLWLAVLISSLAFSLFHLAAYGAILTGIGAFIGAFVFGILASWLVIKSDNLLSSIIMHSIVNLYLARSLLVIA